MAHAPTEKVRNIILTTSGWFIILILSVLLLGLLGGERFSPILELFGLDTNFSRGIFVDCSQPANRYKPFCRADYKKLVREPQRSEFQKVEKGSIPFSLHD